MSRTEAARSPPVSVLMPVCNGGPYVGAAVRSILDQTFADFELLVVDDGSRDDSLQTLSALARSDARLRLVSRENRGLVATLNELIAMARGRYVARMDADDVSSPARLARQVAFMDANPGIVALGSRAVFIDPDGLPITEFIDPLTHEQIERALLRPAIGILHPTVMMRRDALVAAGGYRAEFPHVEDLDLFLRLGEVGRLENLPDVLLQYRVHVASISHLHTEKQALSGRRAVAEALRRRGAEAAIEATPGSAPPVEVASDAQLHRKWSWWALNAGNLRTARKHAWLAVAAEPLSLANPRLLACVVRDSLGARR
jgi:glycosyltransferase involved in cell wall biosynthesis